MTDVPRLSVPGVVPLDPEHDGLPGAICVYLLEEPEPILVDPGPSTSLPGLKEALRGVGMDPTRIRHLLLTHVHLDHAGAAGHLAREIPELTVHVHDDGAPHLADPQRLVASTRRTFGEAHDRLWGEVLPVPVHQLRGWRPGDPRPLAGILPLSTPGHIAHHLAWEVERHGVLLSGDALGIRLHPDAPTHPATPPPSVELAAWRRTLTEILAPVEVDAFGVTHFGLHRDFHARRLELLSRLEELALRVHRAMAGGPEAEEEDAERFQAETVETLSRFLPREQVEQYFGAFSAATDWRGMRFHLARTPAARPGEDR